MSPKANDEFSLSAVLGRLRRLEWRWTAASSNTVLFVSSVFVDSKDLANF